MPGVTMEGSGVTPDNNLKNDFLGHCDQCPKKSFFKLLSGVTPDPSIVTPGIE